MTKKRMLIPATVVLALAVGAWIALRFYLPWQDGMVKDQVMMAKYAAIQNGMTLVEVEALMGWPFDGECWKGTDWPTDIGGREVKGWNGPGTITVDVLLDDKDDNTVIAKRFHLTDSRDTRVTSWAGLWRRLGWQR
jgi:hypothetical protein